MTDWLDGYDERNPGVWTGRAWNISFFFYFYACLCHIELHLCVRNQGNYEFFKRMTDYRHFLMERALVQVSIFHQEKIIKQKAIKI